jgi:chloramphenicol 3-O-phosphotransferase
MIYAVTGVMAAGKSTVARALAARFPKSAHIEADALLPFIVNGGVVPREPGEPGPEAAAQLRLRLRVATLAARAYADAGFVAVTDDIIIGARFDHLEEDLAGIPYQLVVLAPSRAAIEARDRGRAKATLRAAASGSTPLR